MNNSHMIQMSVAIRDIERWAADNRLNTDDTGYVLHSLVRFAFADAAPHPFSWRRSNDRLIILGYSFLDGPALIDLAGMARPDTFRLVQSSAIQDKPMPTQWPKDVRYGFEVRVVPCTRSGNVEKDAFQAAQKNGESATRENVYTRWLAAKLGGAVRLHNVTLAEFSLTRVARRDNKRDITHTQKPNALMRGTLSVLDDDILNHIIHKGIGRHHDFGFGMLMLMPAKPDHLLA